MACSARARPRSVRASSLEALARTLLERETLDEADAYAAVGIPHLPAAPPATVG